MDLRNTLALSHWCRSGASLADVEGAARIGLVGNQRFEDGQAVRAYRLLWTWAAPRYEGAAGRAQDRYAARCGHPALERRQQRAQRWLSRLAGNRAAPSATRAAPPTLTMEKHS